MLLYKWRELLLYLAFMYLLNATTYAVLEENINTGSEALLPPSDAGGEILEATDDSNAGNGDDDEISKVAQLLADIYLKVTTPENLPADGQSVQHNDADAEDDNVTTQPHSAALQRRRSPEVDERNTIATPYVFNVTGPTKKPHLLQNAPSRPTNKTHINRSNDAMDHSAFEEISEELSDFVQINPDLLPKGNGHKLINETVSGTIREHNDGKIKTKIFNIVISGNSDDIMPVDQEDIAISMKLPHKSSYIKVKRPKPKVNLFQVSVDVKPNISRDSSEFVDKFPSTNVSSNWSAMVGDTFHISNESSTALALLIERIIGENKATTPDPKQIDSHGVITIPTSSKLHELQSSNPPPNNLNPSSGSGITGNLNNNTFGLTYISDTVAADGDVDNLSLSDQSLLRAGGAVWSAWLEWGACSQTCGMSSTRRRIRHCVALEGLTCPGSHVSIETCVNVPPCLQSNNAAHLNRTNAKARNTYNIMKQKIVMNLKKDNNLLMKIERDLTNPKAQDDLQSDVALVLTNTSETGDNQGSGWSEWGRWSPCSKTCGEGTTKRLRECEQLSCADSFMEQKSCNVQHCEDKLSDDHSGNVLSKVKQVIAQKIDEFQLAQQKSDTEWMSWSEWSVCSVTCGVGEQIRTRTCMVDAGRDKCLGEHEEARICEGPTCPPNAYEDERFEDDQVSSQSIITDTESRNMLGMITNNTVQDNPANYPGVWSEWSKWGECSATCGLGVEQKIRTCLDQPDDPYNTRTGALLNSHCDGSSSTTRHCIRDTCLARNTVRVLVLPEGRYAKLYCTYADRTSTDIIYWITPSGITIKDVNDVQGRYVMHNNYLYIEHVEDYDRGIYHCVIKRTGSDVEETADATLVVQTCMDDDNPCNAGQCIEHEPSLDEPFRHFSCICSTQYTGKFCDRKVSHTGMLALIVIGGLLFLLTCVLCCQRVATDRSKGDQDNTNHWEWPTKQINKAPDKALSRVIYSKEGIPRVYGTVDGAERTIYAEIVNEQKPSIKSIQGADKRSSVNGVASVVNTDVVAGQKPKSVQSHDTDVSGIKRVASRDTGASSIKRVASHDTGVEPVSRSAQSIETGVHDSINSKAGSVHSSRSKQSPTTKPSTISQSSSKRTSDRVSSTKELVHKELHEALLRMELPEVNGTPSVPKGAKRVSVYKRKSGEDMKQIAALAQDRTMSNLTMPESDAEWAAEYEEAVADVPVHQLFNDATRDIARQSSASQQAFLKAAGAHKRRFSGVDPAALALQPIVLNSEVLQTRGSLKRTADQSDGRSARRNTELFTSYQTKGIDNINQNNSMLDGQFILGNSTQDTSPNHHGYGVGTDPYTPIGTASKLGSDQHQFPLLDLSEESSDCDVSSSASTSTTSSGSSSVASSVSSSSESEAEEFEDIFRKVKADMD